MGPSVVRQSSQYCRPKAHRPGAYGGPGRRCGAVDLLETSGSPTFSLRTESWSRDLKWSATQHCRPLFLMLLLFGNVVHAPVEFCPRDMLCSRAGGGGVQNVIH